jgi:hypothetical protein
MLGVWRGAYNPTVKKTYCYECRDRPKPTAGSSANGEEEEKEEH